MTCDMGDKHVVKCHFLSSNCDIGEQGRRKEFFKGGGGG